MKLFNRVTSSNVEEGTINGQVASLGGAYNLTPFSSGLVNVVGDYSWTISPKSSRFDVPYIQLIEKRINNNVLVQQFLYYISAGIDIGGTAANQVIDNFQNTAGLADNDVVNRERRENVINKVETAINDPEQPYRGLYDLEDTGWIYILPYFSEKHHEISNSWAESQPVNFLTNAGFQAIEEGVNQIAEPVNMLASALGAFTGNSQPSVGTYIEKPKQYTPNASGPSYTVTFNLYNTFKLEDIIKNWQFCYLLLYQNLPNRRSKTIFDPPAVYEIFIPGVRRSPLSFISMVNVQFVGSTRLMKLKISDEKELTAIVPDAYRVTLNIQDIFPESRNFMQGVIDEDQKVSVNIKKTDSSGNELAETQDVTVSEIFGNDADNMTIITGNNIQRKSQPSFLQRASDDLNRFGNSVADEIGSIFS